LHAQIRLGAAQIGLQGERRRQPGRSHRVVQRDRRGGHALVFHVEHERMHARPVARSLRHGLGDGKSVTSGGGRIEAVADLRRIDGYADIESGAAEERGRRKLRRDILRDEFRAVDVFAEIEERTVHGAPGAQRRRALDALLGGDAGHIACGQRRGGARLLDRRLKCIGSRQRDHASLPGATDHSPAAAQASAAYTRLRNICR
jgi:hypothetical protein